MQVDRGDQLPLGAHCCRCNYDHLLVSKWTSHVVSSVICAAAAECL